jgi:hypothetical protein
MISEGRVCVYAMGGIGSFVLAFFLDTSMLLFTLCYIQVDCHIYEILSVL